MIEVAKKHNIFIQFLDWYFLEQPQAITKAWINLIKFNLNYFSIPLLLKTFFSYWRKFKWSYGRGFDFKRYLEAFSFNAISRSLGVTIRFFLIIIGIIFEFFIILFGLIALLGWFLLPLILIEVLLSGFKILLF